MTTLLAKLKELNESLAKPEWKFIPGGDSDHFQIFNDDEHLIQDDSGVEPDKRVLELFCLMRNSLPQWLALAEAVEKRIREATYEGNIHDEMCNSLHHTMHCSCGADDVIKALAALKVSP